MGDRLTRRERDILRLLGAGRSTRQIADELGIAESSVIWYARHVVRNVGMRRTDELAHRLAHERARHIRRAAVVAVAIAGLLASGAFALAAMTRQPAPIPSATASATPSASSSSASATTPPRPSPTVTAGPDGQGGATLAPTTAPRAQTVAPPATRLPQPTLAPLSTPGGLPLPALPTLPLSTPRLP